jgi:hypothetical protein
MGGIAGSRPVLPSCDRAQGQYATGARHPGPTGHRGAPRKHDHDPHDRDDLAAFGCRLVDSERCLGRDHDDGHDTFSGDHRAPAQLTGITFVYFEPRVDIDHDQAAVRHNHVVVPLHVYVYVYVDIDVDVDNNHP